MGLISAENFINDLGLQVVYMDSRQEMEFGTSDVNRPGLQFAGYFKDFEGTALRLQVIGRIEMTYLMSLCEETMKERLDTYLKYPLPCIVISRGMDIPEELYKRSMEYSKPLLRSELRTTDFIRRAINYLDSKLAPSTTLHGELLDVYGIGILLTGESGIGKSETALELLGRGHHIVTDDVVDVRRVAENRLIGESPDITRYFMEVRGIGIMDIRAMYGVGAVINNKAIDLVVHLEAWDDTKGYDRLGLDREYETILDVKLPKITIPVRPGRNIAVIVEVAARDFRLRNMKYDSIFELDRRITEQNCKTRVCNE